MVLTVYKGHQFFVFPLTKNAVYLLSRAIDQLGKIALRHVCLQVCRLPGLVTMNLYQHQ